MDDVSLLNLIGRTLCVTCQISRASGCNDGESFHLRYRERRLNWPLERLPGHGACSVYAFIRVISSQLKWLFFGFMRHWERGSASAAESGYNPWDQPPKQPIRGARAWTTPPTRAAHARTHAAEPLASCSACEARVWYSRHIVFWAIRSNFNSLFQSTGNKLFPVVRRRLSNNSRVTGSARWGEDELVAGYLHHYGGNVSYRLGNFRAAGGSCCFSIISDCGGGHVVSELTSRRLPLSYAASPLKRFFILRTCAGRMDAHFNWSDLELNRDAPSTNWDHLQ